MPMSAKELLLSHKHSLAPSLARGARSGQVSLDLDPVVKARYQANTTSSKTNTIS